MNASRRVLITGAAGQIGTALRRELRGRYALLRLLDIVKIEDVTQGEEAVQADIRDFDGVRAAAQGMDCIVHLAGHVANAPHKDTWDEVLGLNIIGTYNAFEAARLCGVRRVVFASSNHAVGFYRLPRPLDTSLPVRPDSLYGVSKVFGEALGRMYADKHGLSVVALRIGSFRERPGSPRELRTWISPGDTAQLVACSIEAEGIHFEIAYGVSDNARNLWRDASRTTLGYRPKDRAEVVAPELVNAEKDVNALVQSEDPLKVVEHLFHGGPLASWGFSGDPEKID